MQDTNLAPVIVVDRSVMLPDKGVWKNRFEIKSEFSSNVYVVSQHKEKGHWGCSCPAWCIHRECKHLRAIGLPSKEVPYHPEIKQI